MLIFFSICHPAQYHMFKNVITDVEKFGNETKIFIEHKDVLEELIESDGFKYKNLLPKSQKIKMKSGLGILISRFLGITLKSYRLLKICMKNRPDLLIGTDISITHVGRLLDIPSIVLNEDDFAINSEFCFLAYPFCPSIISPTVCDAGPWHSKKISYEGYQKLTYLNSSDFQPSEDFVKIINPEMKDYILFRFVSLTAGHDVSTGNKALTDSIAIKIINKIKGSMKIYISSERPLSPDLEKYRIQIPATQIHHFIYFSRLFVSDSQSMTVESCILGTPSIRYNNFVGRISVLEELEKKYGLTKGVKPGNPNILIDSIGEFLRNSKDNYRQKRDRMLLDKIVFKKYMTWFICEFPESLQKSMDGIIDNDFVINNCDKY